MAMDVESWTNSDFDVDFALRAMWAGSSNWDDAGDDQGCGLKIVGGSVVKALAFDSIFLVTKGLDYTWWHFANPTLACTAKRVAKASKKRSPSRGSPGAPIRKWRPLNTGRQKTDLTAACLPTLFHDPLVSIELASNFVGVPPRVVKPGAGLLFLYRRVCACSGPVLRLIRWKSSASLAMRSF